METPTKRGRPFAPGNHAGKGRPPGSRNKVPLGCQQVIEGALEPIFAKMIEMAKKGDPVGLKLFMAYVMRWDRAVRLDLPEITTAEDVGTAQSSVLKEMALGNITPGEAEHVMNVIEFRRKGIETGDLAKGLAEVREEIQGLKENDERLAA
jgi:hypothetical protein